jgi:hypothetical protein
VWWCYDVRNSFVHCFDLVLQIAYCGSPRIPKGALYWGEWSVSCPSHCTSIIHWLAAGWPQQLLLVKQISCTCRQSGNLTVIPQDFQALAWLLNWLRCRCFMCCHQVMINGGASCRGDTCYCLSNKWSRYVIRPWAVSDKKLYSEMIVNHMWPWNSFMLNTSFVVHRNVYSMYVCMYTVSMYVHSMYVCTSYVASMWLEGVKLSLWPWPWELWMWQLASCWVCLTGIWSRSEVTFVVW